jgi:hypothetical protein
VFTIFTLIFFIGIFAIILFIVGLFLPKTSKKIFIFLALFLVFFCFLLGSDWNPSDKEINRFSGLYKIDTLGFNNSQKVFNEYADLTLSVNKNLTFKISRPNPFFKTLSGTWTYENMSDYEILKYKFEGTSIEHDMIPDSLRWEFYSDTENRTIQFTRILDKTAAANINL